MADKNIYFLEEFSQGNTDFHIINGYYIPFVDICIKQHYLTEEYRAV